MSTTEAGTSPVALPVRWAPVFLLVWLVLLLLLEATVRSGLISGLFLPAPTAIAVRLGQLVVDGSLVHHLGATVLRIAIGLLIGATLGVTLGLGMGMSRRLRTLLDPVVAAIHPIPRLAFFPLLIVLFGVGEWSKLAAVALGAFFPMLLNTVAGVRGMLPVHLELARNHGATHWQLFRLVLLPGSLPLMLTGLRLSSNVAFHATIGVEMVGSRTGIGSLLWLSWQTFRIDQLYAVLVVVAALGIGLASLIRAMTARAAPWQRLAT
jgi:NitT/TauT family transport system permease protein